MKNINKEKFEKMNLDSKGMILLNSGKHLYQISKGNCLQNLYLLNDFFVEVSYTIRTHRINRIEVVTDLSRIDLYIDARKKTSTLDRIKNL